MLICGALPPEEMPRLALAKDLSVAEQRQLISWQDPPAWSARRVATTRRPGRGNFMIKIGGRPGIPFRVDAHHEPSSGCTTPTSSGTSRAAAASSSRHTTDANGRPEG